MPARSAWSRTAPSRSWSPTEVVSPTRRRPRLAARTAYNAAHKVTLDDGANVDYSTGTNRRRRAAVADPDAHRPHGRGGDVPEAGGPRLPQRPVAAPAAGQGRPATARPASPSSRTATPLPTTCSAPPATSRSPRSTCSTTSTRPARSGRPRRRDPARSTTRCTYYSDRAAAHRIDRRHAYDDATDGVAPITGLTIPPRPARCGHTRRASCARRPRSSRPSTRWTPTSCRWRRSRTPPRSATADRDDRDRSAWSAAQRPLGRRAPRRDSRPLGVRPVAAPRGAADPAGAGRHPVRRSSTTRTRSRPSGRSRILTNSAPFRNAREPLAQAFKPLGAGRADALRRDRQPLQVQGRPRRRPSAVTTSTRATAPAPTTVTASARRPRWCAFADQFASDRDIAADVPGRRLQRLLHGGPGPGSSTDAGYHDLHPSQQREDLQLRRSRRIARPRVRQRGGAGHGDRRGRLVDQRQRVGLLRVQPLQRQRRPTSTRATRSAAPTTTPRSSASTSGTTSPTRPATPSRCWHQRLPRPAARRPGERRGRCGLDGGCGQGAARRRTPTRCSRPPAT